jgi:hypothetical protein
MAANDCARLRSNGEQQETDMGEHFGFIGLGNMGTPMASRLLDAGHTLTVYDIREEATKPFAARGARGGIIRRIRQRCQSEVAQRAQCTLKEENRKHIGSWHFFELSNPFLPLGSEPFRTESGREEVLD